MFDFFRKIWMALNSATQAKSLAFAIAFGMIVGLTPTFNIHNFIILFIVLIFNIHIGLFVLSSFIFGLLGIILDPLFHQLGTKVLISVGFEPFFTYLYNLPYFRLTNFNNTIVMGSLIVSFALFPLVYFIFRDLIIKYRDVVINKFDKTPVLRWFFYTPSDDQKVKKLPLIRGWGVAVFFGLSAIIVSFVLLFLEPISKYFITKSITTITHRVATIDKINIDFKDSKIDIYNLSLLNKSKDKYLFKIQKITLDFEFAPLFYKKAIIDLIELRGINMSPQATILYQEAHAKKVEDDKANGKTVPKKNDEFVQAKIATKNMLKDLTYPLVSDILKNSDLESIDRIKRIEKEIKELKKMYKEKGDVYDKKKVALIKSDIKSLKSDIKNIKSIEDFQKTKQKIDSINRRIKIQQKSVIDFQKKFNKNYNQIQTDIKHLKVLLHKDYKYLSRKYSMDKHGTFEFIKAIAGDKIYNYAIIADDLYSRVKPYMHNEQDKIDINKYRYKGFFVKYNDTIGMPDLFIKQLISDITYQDNHFNIVASNYSSDQKALDVPFDIQVLGKSKLFDNLQAEYVHKFDSKSEPINLFNIKIKNYQLNDFRVADKLKIVSSNIDLKLNGYTMSLPVISLKAIVAKVNMHFNNSIIKSNYNKQLNHILSKIKTFDVYSEILFDDNRFNYDLKSNIDKQIRLALANELKDKEKAFQSQLQTAMDSKFKKAFDKLDVNNTQVTTIKNLIDADNNKLKDMSKDMLNSYTNRQKEIAKEKLKKAQDKIKSKAKQKLQQKLKSILKF